MTEESGWMLTSYASPVHRHAAGIKVPLIHLIKRHFLKKKKEKNSSKGATGQLRHDLSKIGTPYKMKLLN